MDFPMINEINENTNAAKNEILEAMPAAGATSAEVEAAKTAIIGAMPSGGDAVPVAITVVEQVKGGSGGAVAFNVSGKGYIDMVVKSTATGEYFGTLVIDGVTVLNKIHMNKTPWFDASGDYTVFLRMRFNKNAKFTLYSANTVARGFVVLEG